jgi:hypothetical protein
VPRPSFKPTKEKRKLVKSLAALGLRHEDIATAIGVRSPKTVRKYFGKELAHGTAEATAAVARAAWEMASSGKFPVMTRFWLNTVASASPDTADVDIGDEDSWDGEDWNK